MTDPTKAVPLTCHGHSRPITHLTFSALPSQPPSSTSSPHLSSQNPSGPASNDSQQQQQQQQQPYFLLSSCKDLNPMLRDGATGDWIGTFLGHKGAVWSARLTPDAGLAVTGSADFTARVWDTFTGACLGRIPEAHIVRAVGIDGAGRRVCTGGMEKRVKIWDVERLSTPQAQTQNQTAGEVELAKDAHVELGRDVHKGTVKSLLWTKEAGDSGLVSACDDGAVRWWDMRTPQRPVAEARVDGPVGSCELNDVGAGGASMGTLSVAAGKTVYFFDGARPGALVKKFTLNKEVASVAVSTALGRFVTGSGADTWVRVWDLESGAELETGKGHHGPVWTVAFSPDDKLYATGSEDGTIKLWKAGKGAYGLWR